MLTLVSININKLRINSASKKALDKMKSQSSQSVLVSRLEKLTGNENKRQHRGKNQTEAL